MKHIINFFLILFICTITVYGQDTNKTLQIGQKAPAFALPNLQNEYIALRDFCGEKLRNPWKNKTKHVVVLSFFATWCKPCIAEIPHLQNLKEKYSEKPVKFYLINVGESKDKISSFLNRKNILIPILLDRYKKIAEKYDALKLPRLFIIDQNGLIQFEKSGYDNNGEKFEKEIEAMFNKLLINKQ